MLKNLNWDRPLVQDDIHSISGLMRWLETKDPYQGYNYSSAIKCPLSMYYTDMGFRFVHMRASDFTHGLFRNKMELPRGFNWIVAAEPHTFGAALKRASAAIFTV